MIFPSNSECFVVLTQIAAQKYTFNIFADKNGKIELINLIQFQNTEEIFKVDLILGSTGDLYIGCLGSKFIAKNLKG